MFIKFNEKYAFLFDRKQARDLGLKENLNVTFGSAYRYTNFSINIFYISSTIKDIDLNNSTDNSSNESKEHEVRIYRFWSYDPINQIPNESGYYVKICSIVNYNNPVFVKSSVDRKGLPFLMKRNRENNLQNLPANYLLNSEYFI